VSWMLSAGDEAVVCSVYKSVRVVVAVAEENLVAVCGEGGMSDKFDVVSSAVSVGRVGRCSETRSQP
jgi:hypothetical protein